jgi:hypothetical protein
MNVLNDGEESVAFEAVEPSDGAEQVCQPDSVRHSERLYQKHGYRM